MKDKFILGRYLPLDSLIHRLDPRAKFIFVFLFIILVFSLTRLRLIYGYSCRSLQPCSLRRFDHGI